MKDDDFESWSVPSPRRLSTLDAPKFNPWRVLSVLLAGLAALCFVAWQVLK